MEGGAGVGESLCVGGAAIRMSNDRRGFRVLKHKKKSIVTA